VLDTPQSVLDTPHSVLDTPFRVLDTPCRVLDTPFRVLDTPARVLDPFPSGEHLLVKSLADLFLDTPGYNAHVTADTLAYMTVFMTYMTVLMTYVTVLMTYMTVLMTYMTVLMTYMTVLMTYITVFPSGGHLLFLSLADLFLDTPGYNDHVTAGTFVITLRPRVE